MDAVAEGIKTYRKSPTKKNNQLTKAECLAAGVSPNKLEMTGRINTAKASPRKKDPELTKPARIRIGQNEHGPVYSEPEVTIGDNRKDEKIKANV